MNLLLLAPEEITPDGRATLAGARRQHALEVLKLAEGDTLRCGVRGGRVGTATVLSKDDPLQLQVALDAEPPARPGLDLILAIPRPKALRRLIPAIASLGFDRVVLLNAARVEKSYFDSKVLAPGYLDELLRLGLEQAKDTVAPRLIVRERFKPFVEDDLDAWAGDAKRHLLHPGKPKPVPSRTASERCVLAVGPEGGWVPFELELLAAHGFSPVSLGDRPYRVEVVVPMLAGVFQPSH
ncbi:MAG: 16S rRNA (uracil(1498)-N(3))-methyltransferase [Myxococcaceae bacterium]